jgi:hypothetical protein
MKINSSQPWVLGFVGLIALGIFFWGLFAAGYYTLWISGAPKPNLMPDIAVYFVSTVSALLLTNLGAYLGISVTRVKWRPESDSGWLQFIAVILYVLALTFAAYVWFNAGFTEDESKIVGVIPELSRSGIAVLIAGLTAALGLQTGRVRAVRELTKKE